MSPSSPPGVYVADVRLGGRSVLNTPIRADENDREPIEVVVRDDGAHIAGTLLSSGRGLGFSEVVLVPNAPRRTAFAHYKTVMTDYHGHFEFVDVPPGEYKLFAWASTRWRVDKRGIPVEV